MLALIIMVKLRGSCNGRSTDHNPDESRQYNLDQFLC